MDYAGFYDRMQNMITTIVLSQTMTTEDGSSLSQAAVHMEVREELVESDSFLINGSWNRQIGTWLTEYNFPGAATPIVSRIMGSADGKKPLAERDKLIVDMGHRLTSDYITETYGVEVDESQPAPSRSDEPNPPTGDDKDAEMAEEDSDLMEQALLAALGASEDLEQIADLADGLVQPIIDAAEQEPHMLLGKLAELYPALDGDALQERLTNILFVAGLWGRMSAELDVDA